MTDNKIEQVVNEYFSGATKGTLKGYLGRWVKTNHHERLKKIRLEDILEPFTNRPGVQPWAGEHIGKWLHAACHTWNQTGDAELKEKMDGSVKVLISTQKPDGYLGIFLDDKRWSGWDVWSHKYNLIGLLTYYKMTGNQPALEAACKVGDLLCRTFGDGEGQLDIVNEKHSTHMGMASTSVLEPMVMLYRVTGNEQYLAFCHYLLRAWEQPNGPKLVSSLLAHGNVRNTANHKAYEMMSCLLGLIELYYITGEQDYFKACSNAWEDVHSKRHYPTGTSSHAEHFGEDHVLPTDGEYYDITYKGPGEGCVTVTWLQLTLHLWRLTGDIRYVDEIERITYNALIGSQSPRTGQVCYFVPVTGRKRYGEVEHGITPDICCCASSVPRGIAMMPQYAAGLFKGSPAILLYEAADYAFDIKADGKPLSVAATVESQYPSEGKVCIRICPDRAEKFSLNLYVPKWSTNFKATINGKVYTANAGSFLVIDRQWDLQNQIGIEMEVKVEPAQDIKAYPGKVWFERGPQVLVADQSLKGLSKLPKGWIGEQFYSVDCPGSATGEKAVLVPFADGGQTRAEYNMLFDKQ